MTILRSTFRALKAARRAVVAEFDATRSLRQKNAAGHEARSPFAFDPDRYAQTFLVRTKPDSAPQRTVPRRVFVLWTGENELTPNREKSLSVLRAQVGSPIELVTPETLSKWIVPEHPLHPAYADLSLVHRSDYLRAYLLHHHGGGYADLKAPTGSWDAAFRLADQQVDAWLIGCAERDPGDVAQVGGVLGRDLAANFDRLSTCCSMIARAKSPFTLEWLREIERRLDYYEPHLRESPGGVFGSHAEYPVTWTDLMGNIYHPLQLKYLQHVALDPSLYLDYENYR